MFIGHYAVSFAAKSMEKKLPLWVLFLAVQFVDIAWASLVLLDIEKFRIVPGFTASNPLDLYYMPYTHSLAGALGWGILIYLLCRNWRRSREAMKTGVILALAVFSHWLLDYVVHVPDLPLFGDTHKVGLGLWNYAVPALMLEVVLLFGCIWLYLRTTRATSTLGEYGVIALGLVMLAVQVVISFGPPPVTQHIAAMEGLVFYAIFTGLAAWLETKRTPMVHIPAQ
ncbi:MAG: hypothetical protein HYS18_07260 [Burkholderiales bacterium]|nr:hypothetical protein [Burkholderiales bacterium]